jgi:hypothetical protein
MCLRVGDLSGSVRRGGAGLPLHPHRRCPGRLAVGLADAEVVEAPARRSRVDEGEVGRAADLWDRAMQLDLARVVVGTVWAGDDLEVVVGIAPTQQRPRRLPAQRTVPAWPSWGGQVCRALRYRPRCPRLGRVGGLLRRSVPPNTAPSCVT